MMLLHKLMDVWQSIKLVLKSRRHLTIMFFSSALMSIFAILIPTLTIPGNTLGFQISLLNLPSIALIIVFSILFGLSMSMNVYAISSNRARMASMAGREASTGIVSMIGAMFSGPLCASCIATILGLFGLGSATTLSITTILFSYRTEILVLSLILIITSIYFAGRRINKICEKC